MAAVGDGDDSLDVVGPNLSWLADATHVGSPGSLREWAVLQEVTVAGVLARAPWLRDTLLEDVEFEAEPGDEGEDSGLSSAVWATHLVGAYASRVPDRIYGGLSLGTDADPATHGAVGDRLDRSEWSSTYANLLPSIRPGEVVTGAIFGLPPFGSTYTSFLDAVTDHGGLEAATLLWDDPGNLPTEDELEHPDRWIDRVVE